MRKKTTGDLNQELMSQADLDRYIKENEESFLTEEVAAALTEIYRKKNIFKAELARQAGMSEVYLHQVFSGRRKPSRDRLLCLCIGMEADLEEIQRLLKRIGYAPIYPRLKRDAIIIHGIIHRTSLAEINDNLFKENEKTLF